MKIWYNNLILDSATTITPSSEDSNFPFSTALLDPRLSRFGRTLGIISENIVFHRTTAYVFTDVIIAGNNFTADAVVKIQANATDVWTSPTVDVTMTRQANGYYTYKFSADQTYAYVRIVIADTTNTEDYLKINKIFLGTALIMPGIEPSASLPISTNSEVYENETGQIYTDKRTQIRNANVKFPTITETQRQSMLAMFEYTDITEPFFMALWEDSLTVVPILYARLMNPIEPKKLQNLLWTLDFNFRECK